MKKTVCLLLTLLMVLFLISCGTSGVKESDLTDVDVDLDLTALSSTMVYSEVYNMMLEPESYIGKTIRITGAFDVYEDETGIYFACIIADATACCAQGLEFVPEGDFRYPDDFPAVGEDITVSGTFTLVSDGQYRYMVLEGADMTY